MTKRKRRTKAEIEAVKKKSVKKTDEVETVDVADFDLSIVDDPEELAKIPNPPVIVPVDLTDKDMLSCGISFKYVGEEGSKHIPVSDVIVDGVYKWTTPSGGLAVVRNETIDKAKERFQFTGSNEEFIKSIQKKIDYTACANPTWVMQQVFEELVK